MLEPILDSKIKEKILFTLLVRKEAYAREIASIFNVNLSSIQNQLKKLEKGGVLVSKLKGRTRLYLFNPRYAFGEALGTLLAAALSFMPSYEKEKYYTPRLRPRRSGKRL